VEATLAAGSTAVADIMAAAGSTAVVFTTVAAFTAGTRG
jgi:hypothetical protein